MHLLTRALVRVGPIVAALTVLLKAATGFANGVHIFDSRKSLPLTPNETVYHDYYINAGPEAGLRKGMYVSVIRYIPVYDPIQNKAQADLTVEVAKLLIIHVEKNISVGRLDASFSAEDRPLLDYPSIMIGDRLDIGSATFESSKPKPSPMKKQLEKQVDKQPETAELAPGAPTSPSAPAPAPPPPVSGPSASQAPPNMVEADENEPQALTQTVTQAGSPQPVSARDRL